MNNFKLANKIFFQTVSIIFYMLILSSCTKDEEVSNDTQPDTNSVPSVAGTEQQKDSETEPKSKVQTRKLLEENASLADLNPDISHLPASDSLPEEININFSRDVFSKLSKAKTDKTEITIEPAIKGKWNFKNTRSLTFTPSETFKHETEYKVTISQLQTEHGIIQGDTTQPVSYKLKTPRFALRRLDVENFELLKHRASIKIVFTGPVEIDSLKKNSSFDIVGATLKAEYLKTADKNVVMAHIKSYQLASNLTIQFTQKAGVLSLSENNLKAAKATKFVKLPDTKLTKVEILDATLEEGSNGFYIEVACHDHGVNDDNWYSAKRRYISDRCMPSEESVRESIHFAQKYLFTISRYRHGFRIFAPFERGTINLTIDSGLFTIDGSATVSSFEQSLTVPARKPKVNFVAQGRYLPRKAWTNLPVSHLNANLVSFSIAHVPVQNMVFWMTSKNEQASENNATLILKESIKLSGKLDKLTTSWIDVGTLLPNPERGIFEMTIKSGDTSDSRRILMTDMNIIAKRTASQDVNVWVTNIHTAMPESGVTVKQIVKSGRKVSSCETDSNGFCSLAPLPKNALDQSKPFAIIAQNGNDMTYLKYSELKNSISETDVAGIPYKDKTPYRAAIYSDRGVYRPGDTAHLSAIVRNEDGIAPKAQMPVIAKLIDPRGNTAKRQLYKLNKAGMVVFDYSFDAFAATGSYKVLMQAGDKTIGNYKFNVEEFVPERMKVKAAFAQSDYSLDQIAEINTNAEYLFGGTAKGSKLELLCELTPAKFTPKNNSQYEYGVWTNPNEKPKTISLGQSEGQLDDKGYALLGCPEMEGNSLFAGAASITARVAVFEAGSGRATRGSAKATVHPENFYIGLSKIKQKVESGKSFEISGAIVDWQGSVLKGSKDIVLEFYHLDRDWENYYDDDGYWQWRYIFHPVLEARKKVTAKNGQFKTSFTANANAGQFLVRAISGRARTDLQLKGKGYWYWQPPSERGMAKTPKPQDAQSLVLSAPDSIDVDQDGKVTFIAPFNGRLLFTIETDKLLHSKWLDVKNGPVTIPFKINSFNPNIYLSAFLVKDPHQESAQAFLPSRAFGVTSVRIKPVAFTYDLKLEAPQEVRSNSKLTVKLDFGKLDGPTTATIAAVDEGILSLTRFKTPDPLEMIFVKRALGIETFETIGWNLLLPSGASTRSTGGDGSSDAGRVQAIKPVALWSGELDVPASGKVSYTFDVPQYRGSLRVMAVGASPKKIGRAEKDVLVRDPIVIQTTIPRFLVKGDVIQAPVFITNLSGNTRKVTVTLKAEDLAVPGFEPVNGLTTEPPLEFFGTTKKVITLKDKENGTVVFEAIAQKSVGAARISVTAKAGDFVSEDTLDVPFSPTGPTRRIVQSIKLENTTTDLLANIKGFVPTTENTTIWATSNPYGASFGHLKHLIRYPYGCIEQTTSSTRPLLFVANLVESAAPEVLANNNIDDMITYGIDRVLSMQLPSGGFSYWPGGSNPTHWATAYATHMLLDAKKLGHPVPQIRLDDALDFIENELNNRYSSLDKNHRSYNYYHNAEAYFHYVLALAERGHKASIKRLINSYGTDTKGQESENSYMLKAALYLAGDRSYENDLRNPDISPVTNKRRNNWSFYSDRRKRGFMLSTFSDLFGNHENGEKLARLVADALQGNSSHWYSTQELVWGMTGLGKYIGILNNNFSSPTLAINGKNIKPEEKLNETKDKSNDVSWTVARASERKSLDIQIKKKDLGNIYAIVSSTGVRSKETPKYGSNGLSIFREFKNSDGYVISDKVNLGDVLFAEITITNNRYETTNNIALVDRFPAGFEVENPRLGQSRSVSWLEEDDIWSADYMNIRDDRIEIFGSLAPKTSMTVVYQLRATIAGSYTLPDIEVSAMYDPDVWARAKGGKFEVTGPWDKYID